MSYATDIGRHPTRLDVFGGTVNAAGILCTVPLSAGIWHIDTEITADDDRDRAKGVLILAYDGALAHYLIAGGSAGGPMRQRSIRFVVGAATALTITATAAGHGSIYASLQATLVQLPSSCG